MRLDEIKAYMYDCSQDEESFDYKYPSKIDAGHNSSHICEDLYEASKSNIKSVGLAWVYVIFSTNEITQTDKGPNDTNNNHSDANRVVSKQRCVRMVDLP